MRSPFARGNREIIRKDRKTGSKPVVLFVGRLQERKRLDILFKACASLPVDLQPELCIVGDGPALENFKAEAKSIFPSTRFFGAKQGKELDDLYTRADLFVLPGTGGLAVQQAMSFALPVIVAEADGTQSDLVRPQNGWQIPSADLAALSAALKAALSDIPRLRKMGSASYKIVSEDVNIETMVASFRDAIRSVLEIRGKSGG